MDALRGVLHQLPHGPRVCQSIVAGDFDAVFHRHDGLTTRCMRKLAPLQFSPDQSIDKADAAFLDARHREYEVYKQIEDATGKHWLSSAIKPTWTEIKKRSLQESQRRRTRSGRSAELLLEGLLKTVLPGHFVVPQFQYLPHCRRRRVDFCIEDPRGRRHFIELKTTYRADRGAGALMEADRVLDHANPQDRVFVVVVDFTGLMAMPKSDRVQFVAVGGSLAPNTIKLGDMLRDIAGVPAPRRSPRLVLQRDHLLVERLVQIIIDYQRAEEEEDEDDEEVAEGDLLLL